MKNVLMIAYHYPPEGGSSGVLRTLKFSKYLPQYGWVPHVLTLKESSYPTQDTGLLPDIPPEAVVHRTFALDTARHLSVKGKYLSALAIPDRFVSWLPFGVIEGRRVAWSTNLRALYSTSPPPTAHLIAGVLKMLTSLPWVADFRDPWVEEGIHPRPGTLRYRIESNMERFVVHHADRVIVTTPYLRQEFLSRYPDMPPDKVKVIYNGYDEMDFRELNQEVARGDRFELIHAGLVTPDFRDPAPFFQAVASLIATGELQSTEVRITFLGGGAYTSSQSFMDQIKHFGLENIVDIAGRVSHYEALKRMAGAAVLLLLQASDDTRSLIPAKAFEYLRIGRPILALTLEGATANLLREMTHCHVVDPADRVSLQNAMLALYRSWRNGSDRGRVSQPVQQYERSRLTAGLAQHLDELLGDPKVEASAL